MPDWKARWERLKVRFGPAAKWIAGVLGIGAAVSAMFSDLFRPAIISVAKHAWIFAVARSPLANWSVLIIAVLGAIGWCVTLNHWYTEWKKSRTEGTFRFLIPGSKPLRSTDVTLRWELDEQRSPFNIEILCPICRDPQQVTKLVMPEGRDTGWTEFDCNRCKHKGRMAADHELLFTVFRQMIFLRIRGDRKGERGFTSDKDSEV